MSDLQPAADDIVISQGKHGYLVGKFESVSLHRLYETDSAALQVAHRDARDAQVDVWFTVDGTAWRVKRFRPTDEVPPAACIEVTASPTLSVRNRVAVSARGHGQRAH